jgi:hypothetical protein
MSAMVTLRLDDSRVSWRRVDEDIVAIDLQTSEYVTVNASGRALWLSLAAGTDLNALVVVLQSEARKSNIDLDEATARRDIGAFLGAMRARGLITEI